MKLFLLGIVAFSALLLSQCYGDLPNPNSEDLQEDEFEEVNFDESKLSDDNADPKKLDVTDENMSDELNNDEPKKTEDFTDLDELDDVQQLDVLLEDVKLQLDDSKFPTSDEITDKEDLLEIEEFDNPKKLNELTVQQKSQIEEKNHFSLTINCNSPVVLGSKLPCRFQITNNDQSDHSLLKRNTPLDGLVSDFLEIHSANGSKVKYDGVHLLRTEPSEEEFVVIKAGMTASATIDLTTAYSLNQKGQYKITYKSPLTYIPGAEEGEMNMGELQEQTLSSDLASATVTMSEGGPPRLTIAQTIREQNPPKRENAANVPLQPIFQNYGSRNNYIRLTTQLNKAVHFYTSLAIQEVELQSGRYRKWFGAATTSRKDTVKNGLQQIKSIMESERFTYIFGGTHCRPNVLAYTWHNVRRVHYCNHNYRFDAMSHQYSQFSTVIHELTHAIISTDDHAYGHTNTQNLARRNPDKAIDCAANFAYFFSYIMPINYGVDSIAIHGSHTYATKGPVYVRYSDRWALRMDCGYPKLIMDNWGGQFTQTFNDGFDSMITLYNNVLYIIKGSSYYRYRYGRLRGPYSVNGNWGQLPYSYRAGGLDSLMELRNRKVYATCGSTYIRYSNRIATRIDSGYPKPLQGYWGSLNSKFASGFDAGSLLRNGKFYAFKDDQYIRYSDKWASRVDRDYPKNIRGYWGKYTCYR